MTRDITNTLYLVGFTENCIVETILVTENPDGSLSPAPMGVIHREGSLEFRPYKSSNTYRNIKETSRVRICLSVNPLFFLKTAFKEEETFNNDAILEKSGSVIYADKISEEEFSDYQALIRLEPKQIEITKPFPTVFSRGRALAIEAVIHATRIKVFHMAGDMERVKSLLSHIQYCFDVIERVSETGSPEKLVVEALRSYIPKWGISF